MPFPKGQSGNPSGNNGQAGRKVITKVQKAINAAIDLLGKRSVTTQCGVTELANLICDQLQDNPVATLKALAPLLPKDVAIDVTHTQSAKSLTDDQLADIIAERARSRLLDEKVINPEDEETVINQ